MPKNWPSTTLWKIRRSGIPKQLNEMFTTGEEGRLLTERPRLQTTETAFRRRSARLWNGTPQEVRESGTLRQYKTSLKRWMLETRLRRPPEEITG